MAVTVGRCYLVSKIMGLAGFKQLPGEESLVTGHWSRVKTWTERQRQNTNQSRDNESCVAIVRAPQSPGDNRRLLSRFRETMQVRIHCPADPWVVIFSLLFVFQVNISWPNEMGCLSKSELSLINSLVSLHQLQLTQNCGIFDISRLLIFPDG